MVQLNKELNSSIAKKIWLRNSKLYPLYGISGVVGYIIYHLLEGLYYTTKLEVQIIRGFLIISLIPLFILRRITLKNKIKLFNILLLLYCILEFEIELAANENDFNFNIWFPIPLAIFFQSVFFIGRTRYFIMQYMLYFIYFFVRIKFVKNLKAEYFLYYVGLIYQMMIFLFLLGFHYFLFIERYNQIRRNNIWKRETKKRILLERELITFEERELILADIHDTVGGKLIELKLLIERLEKKFFTIPEIQLIKNSLLSTIELLKNKVMSLEEVDFIKKDIYWGLKNYLVRRYSVNEREIFLEVGDALTYYREKIDTKHIRILYQVLQEIINNDLKYGYGSPYWFFSLITRDKNQYLSFKLNTSSKYSEVQSKGRGWKILELRVKKAGGNMALFRENESFSIHGEIDLLK